MRHSIIYLDAFIDMRELNELLQGYKSLFKVFMDESTCIVQKGDSVNYIDQDFESSDLEQIRSDYPDIFEIISADFSGGPLSAFSVHFSNKGEPRNLCNEICSIFAHSQIKYAVNHNAG